MGRRALPKFDPTVDVSQHFFELRELTPPLTATPLFRVSESQDARPPEPLEIEVGSGKGLFLDSASGEHPDRYFIGVEIARKYARFSASRLAKQERSNAAVIAGDAMQFLADFVPDASVAAVHVYFPDPWWKKKHRKRRIMNRHFLAETHRVLRDGGTLHFWTDVEEYFQSSLRLIAEMQQLDGPLAVEEQPADHPMDYRTHFERRMRMHDVTVYRARFVKSEGGRLKGWRAN